ncbi:hypothetical protein BDQ17DRAFT_1470525, partial [Cyathus striatus]
RFFSCAHHSHLLSGAGNQSKLATNSKYSRRFNKFLGFHTKKPIKFIMVRFNVVCLLAIAFGSASVVAASIRDLQLQARGAELAQLVEARDLAYQEFEAREYELFERAEELQSRGFDIDESLLFRRINDKFKQLIIDWLNQADGAAQFGEKEYKKMHSGGTSVAPHCRPFGMKITRTEKHDDPNKKGKKISVEVCKYYAKLECAPDSKKPDKKELVVGQTLVGEGTEPEAKTVYAELAKKS